ncbi:hypothetical protein [Brachybacterium subflavum]|uniref:hypothetical protein n=1 Tax=Brachybacterium subflavum TaxID=2585206 RepID=UPI0012665F9B|nr:hypothetical protein [Brachybacterium subflavum]
MSDDLNLPDGDVVADIHALVAAADGMTPYFYAIAGVPWDGEGLPPIRVTDTVTDTDSLDLSVNFRASRGQFEHRFVASVAYEGYQLIVDVVVKVEIPTNLRPTKAAVDEYGARVSMFAAYPYIREGFSSLASRFELDSFTLPILRQSDGLRFDSADSDEPIEFEDADAES